MYNAYKTKIMTLYYTVTHLCFEWPAHAVSHAGLLR